MGRIQVSQDHVSVGDGCLCSPKAITGRSGNRTCAARAYLQAPALVDPDHASAARTHFGDVDHRNLHRVAAARKIDSARRQVRSHFEFGRDLDTPVFDHGCLGRRPAHVEGDCIVDARPACDNPGRDHTGCWAGLHDVDRLLHGSAGGENAAVGLHDEHRGFHTDAVELPEQGSKIPLNNGPDIGIDHGRAGALILAHLGQNLARKGARNPGGDFSHDVPDPLFVLPVGVGIDQADSNGFHAFALEIAQNLPDLVLIKRQDHCALRTHSFGDFPAQIAFDEREWFLVEQIVQLGHAQAAGSRGRPGTPPW